MIDHKGCLFVDSFWTSHGSMEAVDVRKEKKFLIQCATSQLIILNRYDNICYRICFLLLSWGGFSRLESPCSCERVCVSVVREYVCSAVPRSSNFSRTGVSSRDSGWFWLVLPVCKFKYLVLDHDSILLLGSSKRLSNLLKLFNLLCLVLEILLKVLVLLNQPNDNVETSMNGFLSLSAFFI